MADAYASIADDYDLEHDAYTADLDFYRELARRTGGPVLDAGCGTGRVALALAADGHAVIGLDPSDAMLERARRRAATRAPGRLTWVLGDLAGTRPVEVVNLALVSLNTWNHLIDTAERQRALGQLSAWLVPDGLLAIDLAPPDLGLLSQPDDLVRLVWTGSDPETGEAILKFESRRTDEARQLQTVTLFSDRLAGDGACRRRLTVFDQRYTFPAELSESVERAGFIVQNVFGSYDLEPYVAGSERLIVIAQKPASRRQE